MARDDQFLTTVTVDGRSIGVFDKLSGGDISASDTKYRPGGMVPEVSLGGPTTIANITVSRLYDLERDHALSKTLAAKVGKSRVVTSQQPLDTNGVPFGRPIIRGGTLAKVQWPQADSSANGASMLELDVSVDGSVG